MKVIQVTLTDEEFARVEEAAAKHGYPVGDVIAAELRAMWKMDDSLARLQSPFGLCRTTGGMIIEPEHLLAVGASKAIATRFMNYVCGGAGKWYPAMAKTWEQVAVLGAKELLRAPHIGPSVLTPVRECLKIRGLYTTFISADGPWGEEMRGFYGQLDEAQREDRS